MCCCSSTIRRARRQLSSASRATQEERDDPQWLRDREARATWRGRFMGIRLRSRGALPKQRPLCHTYGQFLTTLLRTQAVELDAPACQWSGRMSRTREPRDLVQRVRCPSSFLRRSPPGSACPGSASPGSASRRSTRFALPVPATQRCSALSYGALSFLVSPGSPWPARRAVADPLPRPGGAAWPGPGTAGRPRPGGARAGPGIAVHSAPVREVRSPQASPLSALPFLAAH
jgi:hypothetical protein